MSNASQFTGGSATKAIVNAYSSGGVSSISLNANLATNSAREVLSAALVAGTLKDVLSITTSGQMDYLTAYTKDATSRTLRIVVVLDGVTVFDATSNAVTSAGSGIAVIAQGIAGTNRSSPMRWNSSCIVRVASSLSETDKVAIAYSMI